MADSGPVDRQLLEETKQKVRQLIQQIGQLAQSGVSEDEFFPEFLEKVREALAAIGGAVWLRDEDELRLEYQVQLGETQLLASENNLTRHQTLLAHVAQTGAPEMVPPGTAVVQGRTLDNPTACLVLLVPLSGPRGPVGIVEVFQRSDLDPSARQGHLQFLVQMTALAVQYLKDRQVERLTGQQELWSQLEQFTYRAHQSLDPKLVAYAAANDGRTLIGCDRVSVALRKGRKYKMEAVSGVESFERRSNTIRLLEQVIKAVCKSSEPLWFTGDMQGIPPQIAEQLDAYLDESQTRQLAVLPLVPEPDPESTDAASDRPTNKKQQPIGALVVEVFGSGTVEPAQRERTQLVAQHTTAALSNAVSVNGIFLMPLWRAIGRSKWILEARTLPKTVAILLAVVGIITALCVVPADFELTGKGELLPDHRREVFAEIDGVVDQVLVHHGADVQAGQTVVMLRNEELRHQLTDVTGRIDEANKRIEGITTTLVSNRQLPPEERSRLSADLKAQETTLAGLRAEQALLKQREASLDVHSPITGQVITWDLEHVLLSRPVQRGQVLLTVADLTQEWVVEVHMPEHRMGHIAEAEAKAEKAGQPLEVEFVLATDPGTKRIGTVIEIARRAELDNTNTNSVLLTIAFSRADLPAKLLRPGAAVTTRIHCGQRAIGYVWLHDLWEWTQREILFRF